MKKQRAHSTMNKTDAIKKTQKKKKKKKEKLIHHSVSLSTLGHTWIQGFNNWHFSLH